MKTFNKSIVSLCPLSVLSTACVKIEANIPLLQKTKSSKKNSNLVTNKSALVNEQIGDEHSRTKD